MIPVAPPSSSTAILAQLTTLRREVAALASQQHQLMSHLHDMHNLVNDTRTTINTQLSSVLTELRYIKVPEGHQSSTWINTSLQAAGSALQVDPQWLAAAGGLSSATNLFGATCSAAGMPLTGGVPQGARRTSAGGPVPQEEEEEEEVVELLLTGIYTLL